MPYRLTLATPEERDLVVDALRRASAQRSAVARGAAVTVAGQRRDGKDVRSSAVRVTALLAEAGELERLAEELAASADVPLVAAAPAVRIVDDRAETAAAAAEDELTVPPQDRDPDDEPPAEPPAAEAPTAPADPPPASPKAGELDVAAAMARTAANVTRHLQEATHGNG